MTITMTGMTLSSGMTVAQDGNTPTVSYLVVGGGGLDSTAGAAAAAAGGSGVVIIRYLYQ